MYNTSGNIRCYDSILHLPHPTSPTHPRMSGPNRAAQFAAFDALTGYGASIQEAARQTEVWRELDESRKAALNRKLQLLLEDGASPREAAITYFQPDDRKDGGRYVRVTGRVKKIDPYAHAVILTDETRIPIDRIFEMEYDIEARW